MTPNRMISRTLAAFPWYSNAVYEEDFSEAIDHDKDFLVSLFIIYIFDYHSFVDFCTVPPEIRIRTLQSVLWPGTRSETPT